MIIILSQKIDTESAYTGDEVFRTYHYPGRYRNQIHTGDVFVYYQGNRYDKSQRYYFGTGWIGNIKLGYDTVRKSINPPWQSSVRPLSEQAYSYILQHSGNREMIEDCNAKLKKAIQSYYISNDKEAILRILEIAKQLATLYNLTENP